MKALISPNESLVVRWISSWSQVDGQWTPTYSEIVGCQRIAEIEPDDKVFEVAPPLHWVDCPNECQADNWYFKDGQCRVKPENMLEPTEE
jgi:hypothetical protein